MLWVLPLGLGAHPLFVVTPIFLVVGYFDFFLIIKFDKVSLTKQTNKQTPLASIIPSNFTFIF